MLENMQTESIINFGIWKNFDEGKLNVGFGLVQWTPVSKYFYWANGIGDPYRIIPQLMRIENNIQYTNPNKNFLQFTQSTESVYDLAVDFLKYYEKPKVADMSEQKVYVTL